jgi:hypothetical protein
MAKNEARTKSVKTAGRSMKVDTFTVFTVVLVVLLVLSQAVLLLWLDLI